MSDPVSEAVVEVSQHENDVFAYLDELRESGVTNMFGATPYVEEEFDIPKSEARTHLLKWMETYGKERVVKDS